MDGESYRYCGWVKQLKGNLDAVFTGEGFVLLTGWLAESGGVRPPPAAVVTLWDGAQLPLRAYHTRPDLTETGLGACAFQLVAPVDGELPAEAGITTSADGLAPLAFSLATVRHAPFEPLGTIEHVGLDGVWGWIFDPALRISGKAPVLRFDGWLDVPLKLDVPRGDLPFEAARTQPFGFHLPLRALLTRIAAREPNLFLLDGGSHRYELICDDRAVVALDADLAPAVSGRVEKIDKSRLHGWAVAREFPDLALDIEILADNTPLATVSADRARIDLKRERISQTIGGFRLPLGLTPSEGGRTQLAARPLGSAKLLRGVVEAELVPQASRGGLVPHLLPSLAARGIAVIVPIYNAAEDLALCLESLVAWTTLPARLILLDDASPDPAVREALSRYEGRAGVEIHRSAENRGFTRSCNHGIALAGRDDVVLLNSDTAVGPRWLEGLRAAAYSHPRHGSATPMSTNAGIFSFPHSGTDNALAGGTIETAARLAAQGAGPFYPTVPTGHGFCLYLRRDCLDETGGFDEAAFPRGYGEENDLCLRARGLGWTHVLDDRTLVFHKRSASFKEAQSELILRARETLDVRYPEYGALVDAMKRDPLIAAARWRMQAGAARLKRESIRPRVLFVVSTETGGTPQTNRDLMAALADRYDAWLLRCDAERLLLYRAEDGFARPVETLELPQPIKMADHRSHDYDELVGGILLRRAIELVHIRHLGWHSIDLPRVAQRFGVPVVMSFHDFYTVCPTVKLLDENRRFCAGRCTEGDGYCQAELWPASEVPHLKHRFVHRWRDKMRLSLAACDAYVTTSASAAGIVSDAFPAVAAKGFDVIPHGRSFEAMANVASVPAKGERLRVLLPGNLSPAKGSHLVNELAAMAGDSVEFHILGDPGIVSASANVVLHGRYQRDEFAARAAEIRPHLGAIFSIWAETWSHTLTEMWACGLPVLALDIGAVAERIARQGGGWLMPVESTATELLARLQSLAAKPAEFTRARKEVRRWQEGEGVTYDTAAMAAEYDRVYRRVLTGRRAFAAVSGEL
jgi:GT2 family glycosyltransferase/glycosyltransferase involved in cell wall biosynthesis